MVFFTKLAVKLIFLHMNVPKIINAGVYRHAQKGRQVVEHPWIALSVSGLVRRRVRDPRGRVRVNFDAAAGGGRVSYLGVSAPGFLLDFEYGADRENYVAILDWDGLRFDCDREVFVLDYDGVELEIPEEIYLSPAETAFYRRRFEEIMEKWNSAIPGNMLAAEIMTQELFLRFMEDPGRGDDIVETFRKHLDGDTLCEKSILRHCRELGVNRDVLRARFAERYKLSPSEYRINRRLKRILYLFTYSDMSLKEIAADVGMKNATHLNALIRKHYGKTPRHLCMECRSGKKQFPDRRM